MTTMVLKDQPETGSLILPPDNLTRDARLSRLFSGIENRWRLLAVLTLKSGPSNLMKRELVQLAEEYGPEGLAVRLVFIGSSDITILDRELTHWTDEHIVASGDNIHALRFLNTDTDYLPCLKLYTPKGFEKISLSGFDTEEGLDILCRILSENSNKKCKRAEAKKNPTLEAVNPDAQERLIPTVPS